MGEAGSMAIGWRLGSLSGWGVYGTNLALELQRMGRNPVLLAAPHRLDLDAAAAALAPAFKRQQHLEELIGKVGVLEFDFPVLHGLRNDFQPALDRQIARGSRNVGVIFFEDTQFSQDGLARAREYELIVTGSTWNRDILEGRGLTHVVNVFQGVDTELFHAQGPSQEQDQPKKDTYPGRFVVFSGGKLEYRKAQDVVIAAFREFHARHPDALLIFAWGNQWPGIMPTIARSPFTDGAPDIGGDGAIKIGPWLENNGLKRQSFVDLGMPANRLMPDILAAADAAIFANRCEPGTNLVAMESLAAGVPSVIAMNTGQLDIADPGHSYPLHRQSPVEPYPPYQGTQGWMEPSVDEVIERLEEIHAEPDQASARGRAAAAFMRGFSWSSQIAELAAAIDALDGA
jgi:glycosyltransferase involved in cell wall biosynthesis